MKDFRWYPLKLLRDGYKRVVDEEQDSEVIVKPVDYEDLLPLLIAKLMEEVTEYLQSGNPTELADVIEVCIALAGYDGIREKQLLNIMQQKREEKGAFAQALGLYVKVTVGK